MLQKDQIAAFIEQRIIAVVGVSRNGDLPANLIFNKFIEYDYTVYPINPKTNRMGKHPCYPNLKETPEKAEAVMLAGTPSTTEKVAKDCIELGINHIWMHRGIGPGSYSPEAERYCLDHGVTPIVNGCPMMFVGHVDFFHRFLKWTKS